MKVVIRAQRREERNDSSSEYYSSCRKYSSTMEFHSIDLENGSFEKNSLPTIIKSYVFEGNLVSLDSFIYLLGGGSRHSNRDDDAMGMCRFHSSKSQNWESISSPSYNPITTASVVLDGKIYNMGYPCLNPEVYDPVSDTWSDCSSSLPRDILKERISHPVLADPANHRILFHLLETDKLYAFNPNDGDGDGDAGTWERLADQIDTWNLQHQTRSIAAVACNILYNVSHYNHPDLTAYDLITGKYLKVSWSTELLNGNRVTCRLFDAVLVPPKSMGGILWLASWWYGNDGRSMELSFVKIKVRRNIGKSELTITPIAHHHSFLLPGAIKVHNILPY